jgi:hypothetical protein
LIRRPQEGQPRYSPGSKRAIARLTPGAGAGAGRGVRNQRTTLGSLRRGRKAGQADRSADLPGGRA